MSVLRVNTEETHKEYLGTNSPRLPNTIYCDVFGRIPSLLGNRKLNTSMDKLTTRYCCVAWLPSNRGRMVTWICPPLLYCCVHVGCIATNSGKASVSIGTVRCCKGKAIHNNELVSRWKQNELVYASEWVSLHQWVPGIRRVQCSQWIIEGGSQCLEELQ
jgi:hypothetical protein